MFTISQNVADAFLVEGIRALRQSILLHWSQSLRRAGTTVGDEGRNAILHDIEAMARDQPDLSVGDLTMLADLALTRAANEIRSADITAGRAPR